MSGFDVERMNKRRAEIEARNARAALDADKTRADRRLEGPGLPAEKRAELAARKDAREQKAAAASWESLVDGKRPTLKTYNFGTPAAAEPAAKAKTRAAPRAKSAAKSKEGVASGTAQQQRVSVWNGTSKEIKSGLTRADLRFYTPHAKPGRVVTATQAAAWAARAKHLPRIEK